MATNSTVGKKTDITIDDLSAQIELLKSDISTLTSTLANYGKAKGTEVTEGAKACVRDLGDAGRERALEAQLQAEEFVRTQPGTALGIAAGIGFIVGLITARR